MESYYFKSVVSLVDSTHSRKLSELSPSPPIRTPSLAPVLLPRKLTDFSISRILGLESDNTHKETVCAAPVHRRHPIQTPSSQNSYSETRPKSSPCSDNTSSSSDCDSEPDRLSTHSEQHIRGAAHSRKERHRTTFSPIEVWELERAYRRQPYLMRQDEEDLVQRLRITAESVKYWFQNRRAKSRKEEKMTSRYRSSLSNQFGRSVRRVVLSERQQFRIQSPPEQWKHAECTRMSYQALETHLKDLSRSRPIRADNHYSSFKSTGQLRSCSSLPVPMSHADQFKRRPAESARLPHSGGLHRYQPY